MIRVHAIVLVRVMMLICVKIVTKKMGGECIGGCYTCETDLYEWHEYEVRGDKLFCGSRFCVRDDTHPDSDDEEDSDNEEDD